MPIAMVDNGRTIHLCVSLDTIAHKVRNHSGRAEVFNAAHGECPAALLA